jgi:hypothetical protein
MLLGLRRARHGRDQTRNVSLPAGVAVDCESEFAKFLRQARPIDEPHHQERIGFVFPDFVNGDDIWMIQFGDRFGLAAKARQRCSGSQIAGRDHF